MSPIKVYSPIKKLKQLLPTNGEKSLHGASNSNNSVENASTSGEKSQPSEENSYRSLPKEATIDSQVAFLPLWAKMLNTSPITSDTKIFKDMKFVLTGIENMISVDRYN